MAADKDDKLTHDQFEFFLEKTLKPYMFEQDSWAVAVSGGPDSMALLYFLSQYTKRHGGKSIHALSVDHGLRPESWQEALAVGGIVAAWPHVEHHVLEWSGDKPQSAIQDKARDARYDLMEQYCKKNDIDLLFLAHHLDDQAETFLFRLAKGSGVDGLACMKPLQKRGEILLARPLLEVHKDQLIACCHENAVQFVSDPSNQQEKFARVRLRNSMDILAAEGLSAKRLGKTAQRLARAQAALDHIAAEYFEDCSIIKNPSRIEFNFELLKYQPEDIILRVLKMARLEILKKNAGRFGPREEKFEALLSDIADIANTQSFQKRTLGGIIFEYNHIHNRLILTKE